ncbi:MAG: L,D-transpeptidase family protein, partial [Pseudomonadota bacterium]
KIGSHGCVRMHNDDIIALFDMVPTGTPVMISDE